MSLLDSEKTPSTLRTHSWDGEYIESKIGNGRERAILVLTLLDPESEGKFDMISCLIPVVDSKLAINTRSLVLSVVGVLRSNLERALNYVVVRLRQNSKLSTHFSSTQNSFQYLAWPSARQFC